MKTRYLVLLAVLAFLGFSTPAFAPPPGACNDWPQCNKDDGSSGGNTPQVIGVHGHGSPDPMGGPLWAPTDNLSTCVLQKNSGKSLSGAFPRHALCATLTTNTADAIRDDIILIVDIDNRGVVLGIEVQGQDFIGGDGIVHITDVMVPVSVDNNPDGTIVIHVHADNVNLYKCDTHVLKQKSICDILVGFFALHDLVYTPDP